MAAAPDTTEARPDPIGAPGLEGGRVAPRVGAWAVLTPAQATRRWLALGGPIPLLYAIPSLGAIAWPAALFWGLVVLRSISRSATRQGPHDRFAGSVVVGQAGWSVSPFGCLVLALLMVVAPIVALVGAATLSGVLRELLSGIATATS